MEQYNQPPFSGYNNQPQRPTETFLKSIKTCFYKYVDFNGRASRAEFWWWVLFTCLVSICLDVTGSWIISLLNVAIMLPSLAVMSRRLHDIGKGAGYMFIGLIPLVGQILLIIWCCEIGELHPNRFGPNPYGYDDGMPPKPYTT